MMGNTTLLAVAFVLFVAVGAPPLSVPADGPSSPPLSVANDPFRFDPPVGAGSDRHAPADTIRVAGNLLEAASLGFARALAELSSDRMAGVLAPGGIHLQLDGQSHTGLSSRQAVTSLRDFFRGYDGGATFVTRAAPLEGSPDRGFAEVLWSARMTGTSQEVRRTLFVGLNRDTGEWRVDEVRFLR